MTFNTMPAVWSVAGGKPEGKLKMSDMVGLGLRWAGFWREISLISLGIQHFCGTMFHSISLWFVSHFVSHPLPLTARLVSGINGSDRAGCSRASNSVGREVFGERPEGKFRGVDLDRTGCGWPVS